MRGCCEVTADVPAAQRRILQIVFGLNLAMFAVEFVAGLLAHSTSLLADSVDMLGDAIVYGFSLSVIGHGAVWQARAALLKGAIMAAFALGVLAEVGLKLARGLVPAGEWMGGVGFLAILVNTSVLVILWPRRGDDINMRSAWLCSRNDVVANAGVLLAAAGVALTASAWPDIVVGLCIAALFGTSAIDVLREARRAAREHVGRDVVHGHRPARDCSVLAVRRSAEHYARWRRSRSKSA